jgi:hypothetical protein
MIFYIIFFMIMLMSIIEYIMILIIENICYIEMQVMIIFIVNNIRIFSLCIRSFIILLLIVGFYCLMPIIIYKFI